jgi:hypothetical protein
MTPCSHITKREDRMGRPTIGDRPMTAAERQQRRRDRLKAERETMTEREIIAARIRALEIALARARSAYRRAA